MKSEKLFREIGAVGDDLIEEAASELPTRRRWALPAACAACAVLAVAGIWIGGAAGDGKDVLEQPPVTTGTAQSEPVVADPPQETPQVELVDGLPVLTLDSEAMWNGMGFEGIWAYDISEYHSGAPELPEELPDALPVFTNPAPGEIFELTPEEEAAQLARVREYFAAEIDAGAATAEIWSDPRVEFEPGLTLPEEYRDAERSLESAQTLGEYLLLTYPKWFAWMETPTVSVCSGDYNIYGEQSYTLYVYDAGQNAADSLTGSAYRSMRLCLNEAGELWLIWIDWPDLSDVIGNYPIISALEAQSLLLDGSYVSSVPYEVGGEDAIRDVELCYRKDQSQVWIPYYRFWVEVSSEAAVEQLGLNTYGAYYVPAVEGRYIANMPTYDGSFN